MNEDKHLLHQSLLKALNRSHPSALNEPVNALSEAPEEDYGLVLSKKSLMKERASYYRLPLPNSKDRKQPSAHR